MDCWKCSAALLRHNGKGAWLMQEKETAVRGKGRALVLVIVVILVLAALFVLLDDPKANDYTWFLHTERTTLMYKATLSVQEEGVFAGDDQITVQLHNDSAAPIRYSSAGLRMQKRQPGGVWLDWQARRDHKKLGQEPIDSLLEMGDVAEFTPTLHKLLPAALQDLGAYRLYLPVLWQPAGTEEWKEAYVTVPLTLRSRQ